jgi:hypothetical protein
VYPPDAPLVNCERVNSALDAAQLMTHRTLGYERRALVAELLRLFRAQDDA